MEYSSNMLNNINSSEYLACKEMYLQGKSLTEIEKETGFSRKKLSRLLKIEGINIKINNKKHDYNEDFFRRIDSEEKAYWLGFLYADGTVNNFDKYELKLAISKKDIEHLKKFEKNMVFSDTSLIKFEYPVLNGKQYESCKLIITNKNIVLDLIDKGCLPNKTFNLKMPKEIIPKHLMKHFIRGFFDGDGSISKTGKYLSLSFTGYKDFLEELSLYILDELGLENNSESNYVYKTKSNAYCLGINNKEYHDKFYSYIYDNSTIYLERKKQVFDEHYNRK